MPGPKPDQELTAREARILKIRNGQPNLSWSQIAKQLGVPTTTASNRYYAAMKKVEKYGGDLPVRIPLSEGVLEPLEDKVLKRQFTKFVKQLKNGVTTDVLLGLLETGLLKAHWRLANDDTVFDRLNGKELSLLISHLLEKRQLLMGEPTKIVSVEDRRHWDELGVALIQELKRRKLGYDLPPSQYEVIEEPISDG